jgi:hypothetical protein
MSAKDVQYTDPSRQGSQPSDPELDNDDGQAASKFVSGLASVQEQRRKSKRNKNILIILVAVTALAAGGYFLFLKKAPSQPEPSQQADQSQTEQTQQTAPTEEYNSTDLQLALDYPGDWVVDDSEQGLLVITSPSVKIGDSNGVEVDAKVVFTIISAGSDVTGFVGTGGLAVAQSEKITYVQPTQNQREQTYVTLVSFDGTALDVAYITGDSGYQKDQDVPKGDVAKIEPIISVTFQDTAGEPVRISAGQWGTHPALVAAADIIKSLKIN